MKNSQKTIGKIHSLRLYYSLLFLLFGIFIMIGLSFAEDVECGATITTNTVLTNDLDCSAYNGTALTLSNGGRLDLNLKKVIGNNDITCIKIEGNDAWVGNGIIRECKRGILIEQSARSTVINVAVSNCKKEGILISESNQNELTNVRAYENEKRGFMIEKSSDNDLINCRAKKNGNKGFSIEKNGDNNELVGCVAKRNGQQGFKIERGNGNKIRDSKAIGNCRDGIEIDAGRDNLIIDNFVVDNGNIDTCDIFGDPEDPEDDYYYKPWYYAGIDVTKGIPEDENPENPYPSEYNEIKNNYACGNRGCIGSDSEKCNPRERNYWDENVCDEGNCASLNEWENNTVCPECTPGP